jgi:hypothetical protein
MIAIAMGASAAALAYGRGDFADRESSGSPVLVELFTSQGCSSCPPADALAVKLARDPAVLVISRPVTYWDRLGWKDTLARQSNTDLQRAYAQQGFDSNGVYTPQMVFDGDLGAVGSDASTVRHMIARSAKAVKPSLALDRGAIAVDGKGTGELVLVALRSSVSVGIGSGENGGRKVVYTNVVQDETRIGQWSGGPARFAIPPAAMHVARADRYAVILRKPAGGPVLAARPIG